MKVWNRLFVLSLLFVFTGSAVYAAPKEESSQMPMDPAMAEQMEKMKELMSPNENHKVLEPFVGEWTYTGKYWMKPESPAEEMAGTAKHELIYGGRFLKQEVEGPWMGETFNGLGYTGYDNIRGEYMTVWFDSMTTGMMSMTGEFDSSTRTLKQTGSHSCPMTGEKARYCRSEWIAVNEDQQIYRSYAMSADGNEYMSMELKYTRVR